MDDATVLAPHAEPWQQFRCHGLCSVVSVALIYRLYWEPLLLLILIISRRQAMHAFYNLAKGDSSDLNISATKTHHYQNYTLSEFQYSLLEKKI